MNLAEKKAYLNNARLSTEYGNVIHNIRRNFEKEETQTETKYICINEMELAEEDVWLKRFKIINATRKLTNADEQKVLTYRYIANKEWVDIQNKLSMSATKVFDIHRKAIQKIEL